MYIKKKKIRRLSSISEMIGEYKKKFKILKKKKKKIKSDVQKQILIMLSRYHFHSRVVVRYTCS